MITCFAACRGPRYSRGTSGHRQAREQQIRIQPLAEPKDSLPCSNSINDNVRYTSLIGKRIITVYIKGVTLRPFTIPAHHKRSPPSHKTT